MMDDLNLFSPAISGPRYQLSTVCDPTSDMVLCHQPWTSKFGGYRKWTVATDRYTCVFVPGDLGHPHIDSVPGADAKHLRDVISNSFIITDMEGNQIKLLDLRRTCQNVLDEQQQLVNWGDGVFEAARILDALCAIDEPEWAIVNVVAFTGLNQKGKPTRGHVMLIRVTDTDERALILSHHKEKK